ncbi:cytochrome b-c1 complex subunit 2, mitochondrial [Venturia canescens]|uniref:cytochrome b-c1 complex subunit 2, mitochondrial n=1 Tax=Venturia canescens TaxID=32260 RepID=UPI001C9BD130|nr:cytochrome b-c1 complex subunit 2, mitochondrial [Venturia canescens]
MACSAIRSPILRNKSVRHYALAAAAQHAPATLSDVQVLGNKVTVAAVENNSPIAQVSVVIRAGSRNETYDTQGINHLLRLSAGLTTSRASYFGITRNLQQLGGNLTATADRETISYTLQVTRDKLGEALQYLEDVAVHQVFKPWEVAEQSTRMRYELSTLPETTRIIELLHKAAFRSGLGYSLYSPKRQIGKISSETLQHYFNTWFSGSRCAVVSTGVSLGEVSAFAANLKLPGGDCSSPGSKFWGGEVRKERNSELATVAVAVEGSGLDKEKDALAFAVLQQVAGTGPRAKWGTSTAPLYKSVASAAGSDPFAVSAINASYSDAGLFGFILSAPANVAGSLTKAAYKWFRTPSLTDADVNRGKTDLKAAILFGNDNNSSLLESLGQQAVLKGRVVSPLTIANEVDKISLNDVKSVATRLSGKVAMASIGDLSTVPYIDQLN